MISGNFWWNLFDKKGIELFAISYLLFAMSYLLFAFSFIFSMMSEARTSALSLFMSYEKCLHYLV
jgi:hypothetical protein